MIEASHNAAHASETHQGLQQSATWKSALIVSLGGSLLVAVSLGPMATELGPASVVVWSLIALVGVLQCFIIGELAAMFPHKTGGTPVYAHEAFKGISPAIGALSNWGYWFGWIPVIATNLILAAGYMKSAFFPDLNILYTAVALVVPMFALNYFGLKIGVITSTIMAVCAIGPLALIALSPVYREGIFNAANLFPMVPLDGSWTSSESMLLLLKWAFVAAWSAYAFESASTVVAEMKNPHKDAPKGMTAASVVGFFAYGVVPFVMLGICGLEQIKQDPSIAFVPAAEAIFGATGGKMVSLMLICALLLGAQTAIIGSSRTLLEMSRDGLTIRQFSKINKYGVPAGSILWNFLVSMACLLIFKENIVALIACSNVGYLIPFMLVIPAFVVLRKTHAHVKRPYKLHNAFVPIALGVTVFNYVLFFAGGFQWGSSVMLTGAVIMSAFIPFYLIRKAQDRKTHKHTPSSSSHSHKKAA